MKIIIIGGTGFIGRSLLRRLKSDGHRPVVLSRDKERALKILGDAAEIEVWNGTSSSDLIPLLEKTDAVVNLAGENIGEKRWTTKRKASLAGSRITLGHTLSEAIGLCIQPPEVLIQASGISIYGVAPVEECTEESPQGTGYLADLTAGWEGSVSSVTAAGVRLIFLRNGLILGPGSFLNRLIAPFRFGLGVVPGRGRNWLSWIHLEDEISAICFLLNNKSMEGPFNLASPNPVTMTEMVRFTGLALGRRWFIRTPDLLMKIIFGEMARETILASQRIKPERLTHSGFHFQYPHADEAVMSLISPELHR